MSDRLRVIPSIEQIRQRPGVAALEAEFGRDEVVDALRAEAEALRARVAGSDAIVVPDADAAARAIESAAKARLHQATAPSLRRVINATGVIVHTNLGRAPLAEGAAARAADLARGYVNLEYDLVEGARGRRDVHAERLLCRLTGADAAVVVNNNAAATLIALAALSAGREAVISRGELVEIGGGFRVPDVMAQSGALLREVGTTNRTRTADYGAAVSAATAIILRVHPSNFRIEGFTERPALADLVALARELHVWLVEDLGSGYIRVADRDPIGDEPDVAASVRAGADVVCFSGDKLLGGPQSGIIVGRAEPIGRIRRHPLMRALRVDKLIYAALEATLIEYVAGRADDTVPVRRMLRLDVPAIERRARAIVERIGDREGVRAEIVGGESTVGGGSAPGVTLPTKLIAVTASAGAEAVAATLRHGDPPIVARIEQGRVLIDLRTVAPDDDRLVEAAIVHAAMTARG